MTRIPSYESFWHAKVKPMYDYIYVDHKQKGEYNYNGYTFKDGTIVLVCLAADSILEADKAFQDTMGKDITKLHNVSCLVVPTMIEE